MQKLHLVGFTADFDGLIFSTRKGAKTGNFVVPIDGKLQKQLAEAERHRPGATNDHRSSSPRLERPESALSPREMQDRIRSGWSLDEVAVEAGVDLDWVRRFAAPVLAEVRRVIDQARAAVYDKPRFGLSAFPLGTSVRRNVIDRGVRMEDEELDECWSAYQLDDDMWAVRFVYHSRGRAQEAEWIFYLDGEELVSRNRLGSQLGHVARSRSRKAAPPATKRTPTPPASVKRRPAASTVAPAAKKAVAKKAVAKKAPAKKAVRRATRAAPSRKTSAQKAPTRATPARRVATARTPAPRKKAARPSGKKPAKRPPRATAPIAAAGGLTPLVEATEPAVMPARRMLELPMELALTTSPSVVDHDVQHGTDAARPGGPPHLDDVEWDQPPQPGPVEVDEQTGIARIDSRRTSRYVSTPPSPRGPIFRSDLSRAAAHAAPAPAAPPRPRRSEPLRGR